MLAETSIPIERFKPRHSFAAVAMLTFVIFGVVIGLLSEGYERREEAALIDQYLLLRLDGITTVFEEQVRAANSNTRQRHNLAEAYAQSPDIVWTRIAPASHALVQGAHPDLELPSNPAITAEVINQMIAEAGEERGGALPLQNFGDETLVAHRLTDGHVFFALFDRKLIAAQFSVPYLPLWIFVVGLISVFGFALYLSSWYLLQKPVEQLSRALDEADDTLELHLAKPLPRNEIGWLGRRIGEWLARLHDTQKELERMAVVAEHTQSAVMILDSDYRTQWVNTAFWKMTGYDKDNDKIIGAVPDTYMRGADTDPEVAKLVDDCFANGKGFLVEAKIHRKDGSSLWVSAEAQPVHNAAGEVTGWICVDTNISERKEVEEQLALRILDLEAAREQQSQLGKELKAAKKTAERSNASKSEFLANMSHEIRTPMNGVLGMADVLMTTNLTFDQKEYVQTIKDSGISLLAIINDILDLSKLEAGKIILDKSNVDIGGIVASVTGLLAPRARAKGLSISCEVSPEVPPEIIEDGGRLRQILLNLLGNAAKFTEEGSIKLSAKIKNTSGNASYLRFEVEDTGVGISDENQRKLFERFEQGDMSGARAAGGTGLGLSICQELTWLMGGEIGLFSEKGKGSTFWIEIPYKVAHTKPVRDVSAAAPAPDPATKGTHQDRLRLLVAEDHVVNQSLMKAFIAKLGHDLVIAPDGVAAVKAVREGSFDMILMDIQMPRMDGVMATKVIRSLESGPSDIPIVAVTANAMAGQRDHYIESGMNGYVSKPVQLEELRAEIDRVWAAHNASPESLHSTG